MYILAFLLVSCVLAQRPSQAASTGIGAPKSDTQTLTTTVTVTQVVMASLSSESSSSSGISFGSPEPFESQRGDIIGGVIGSVVAIHLFAAAVWFFLYQRRKARLSKAHKTQVDIELNTLPIEPPPVVPSAGPSVPARKIVFKPFPPKSSGSHTISSSSTLVAPPKSRRIPRADVE
ncbi:hypothetical protein CcaverHIS002_0300700 [Cutaneotrichosporon cavernicola]|nr:hypothetical protein CcaverHIS002_0300700 [Cutaneotrichosporon cavernicola]BEI97771.1 hypothetical protein CcaverHIS631_0300700 [Cutaneotrichosporon cavernicola]